MGTIQGSKDPKSRVLGPKYQYHYGVWALEPYYFSPWTLRANNVLQSLVAAVMEYTPCVVRYLPGYFVKTLNPKPLNPKPLNPKPLNP